MPVTQEDMENKLRFCAEGLFSEKRQREIVRTVQRLEDLKNLGSVTRLMVLQ
jgi:hypothetical protein